MEKNIAVIPGDGIGPEVISQALKVLDAICLKFNHKFNYKKVIAGGHAIDLFNNPLPKEQLDICINSHAVLLGAVGGPKWDKVDFSIRPEKALIALRGGLKVYANLRPAVIFPQLKAACPLKEEIIGDKLDILVIRELTGGIYFGEKGISEDGLTYFDTEKYSWFEVERIVKLGFDFAQKRNKKLCIVDKANILNSSQLWRKVTESLKNNYLDVDVNYLYVDNAAMQLIRNPKQFDVIVTSNLFGDILTDEASQITGSIGMLASASLGDGSGPGLYEPIHGSAPDIEGKNLANPLATILSAAMMLRYDFKMEEEALCIENAVNSVLNDGWRTADIASHNTVNKINEKLVGTEQIGQLVYEKILS